MTGRMGMFGASLRRSEAGSMALEFALLGPALLVMLLGVLQIGLYMQAFNSLRSIASDMHRTVAVEFQNDNTLTNSQIRALAITSAARPPYNLLGGNLDVTVADATDQRIAGAREITLTLDYAVPNVLDIAGIEVLDLNYNRPIFVLAPQPAT